MTIKTFDANRVGGGTFSLEQDATTGEYKLKEVGFVKLPTLKLPEIEQAAYQAPTPYTPSPNVDAGTGNTNTFVGGRGEGDRENIDYTGVTQLKNIQKEATGGDMMKDATTLSNQLNRVDRTDINQGAVKVEDIRSLESMPQSYQNVVNEYNRHQADVQQRNMTGSVDEEQALEDLMYSRELRNQINEMKGTSVITKEGFASTAGRKDPEIMKAAPAISEDLQKFGPRTVPTGTLTGAKTSTQFGVPDAIKFGQPAPPDKSLMTQAKDILSNAKPVMLSAAVAGVQVAGKVIGGIGEALLGVTDVDRRRRESDISAANSLGYTTNFELGNMNDPGRIAAVRLSDGTLATSSQQSVFVGMNKGGAKSNLSKSGAKRVTTRMTVGQPRVDARYGKDSKEAKEFREKTKNFQKELNDFNSKKEAQKKEKNIKSQNPNLRAGAGDEGGDGCFIKGTLITMFDGSKKPVEKVDLGDNVAIGGKVFAVGRFLNTELYDYKGIKVSGSHMVNEDGTWLRVRDTKHGKSLGDDLNTVYVFGSENRRILINDILFTDYFEVSEQDKLIEDSEDFFNNWKDYGNDVDVDNVATLNMNYEI